MQTFLVYANFRLSAKTLDRLRLNKQCVEAQQLLNMILDYHLLAAYFNFPLPSDCNQWRQWAHILVSNYHQQNFRFIRTDTEYWTTSDISIKQKDLAKDQHLVSLTSTHKYHPALFMWLGHVDALKEYLTAHVDEWLARGYNGNNYKRYNITNSVKPAWVNDINFHLCHRSRLLQKELEAKASGNKRRYVGQVYEIHPDFINAPWDLPYIWPI